MVLSYLKDLFTFSQGDFFLFTQFDFWAFFSIVFAGLALVGNKALLRNTYIAFFSFIFYYKTSGFFVLILIFAVLFNYLFGMAISKSSMPKRQKLFLILGLLLNVLMLFYYKYSYFIADVLNNVFGVELKIVDIFAQIGNIVAGKQRFDAGAIVLPVGISFFTFQNISYLVEVYKKSIKPVGSILNFAFYVSFFPSLLSGPIIRAKEFIPQLYKPFFLSRRQFGVAVFWILNGLIKKLVVSDYLAVNFVDRVFENPTMFSGFENLMALFGYSLQIYADFSGYTDIATGVAMLMGFYLPINFNSPYKATNPNNFWKRWHISLSMWLQTYLYIPMGGNRKASFSTYCIIVTIAAVASILSGSVIVGTIIVVIVAAVWLRMWLFPSQKKRITTNLNMINTMLIGGLWHGASWNFIIWGGLNGLGILVYKYWKEFNLYYRQLTTTVLTLIFGLLFFFSKLPIFKIAFVWILIIFVGTLIRYIYNVSNGKRQFSSLESAWAIVQTFIFITFTRLFFRSGSNLNPQEANQQAWSTAQNMVNQIGGDWNLSLIPNMIWGYSSVVMIFVLGMLVHWLPERLKRRYRLWFSAMPLWLMAIVIVGSVFVIYQFMSADLQKFIYFQF